MQYGMRERTLASRIAKSTMEARSVIRAHQETYRRFWSWSEEFVDRALLERRASTVLGWQTLIHHENCSPTFLANFPMQANGAEMLRLACCLGTERGIEVCAPVHDAVLICSPVDRIAPDVEVMRGAMAEAFRIVLGGFEVRTDASITKWPERYADPRGAEMWTKVMGLIAKRHQRRGVG